MKTVVFNSKFWVPWVGIRLAQEVGGSSAMFTAQPQSVGFGVMDLAKEKPLGGVIYDNKLGETIQIHVAADDPGWLTREMLWSAFDYPFNQLGITKLIGPVRSDNHRAMEFDRKLGFTEEARIRDAYGSGIDLVLLSMVKDQAEKWLNLREKVDRSRLVA